MKPLSLDLKERILAAIQEGKESMPAITAPTLGRYASGFLR
jgi:hypothetical protein